MKNLVRYKRYVINTLIGSLIAAALVAVVSVIIGSFSDTTARILWILASVAVHALVNIALIERTEVSSGYYTLFKNVLYALVPVSLVTSLLGITTLITAGMTGSLYAFYMIILIASLHVNTLILFRKTTGLIEKLVRSNVAATCLTAALIAPQIFLSDPVASLGEYYHRLLAASAIIDGTLTVLILIFYKLYAQNNPKAKGILQLLTKHGVKSKVWVWVIVVFFVLQILPMLIFAIASLFSNANID